MALASLRRQNVQTVGQDQILVQLWVSDPQQAERAGWVQPSWNFAKWVMRRNFVEQQVRQELSKAGPVEKTADTGSEKIRKP